VPALLHFLHENIDYQMLINNITKINLMYKPHFLPDICYYSNNVFPKCLLLSRKYFTIEQIYLQIMPLITAVRQTGGMEVYDHLFLASALDGVNISFLFRLSPVNRRLDDSPELVLKLRRTEKSLAFFVEVRTTFRLLSST
jgi:hypothetical protein